jgi:hypothetical protein
VYWFSGNRKYAFGAPARFRNDDGRYGKLSSAVRHAPFYPSGLMTPMRMA